MDPVNSFTELFKQDVGRWLSPGKTIDFSQISWRMAIRLLYKHLPLRAMLLFRFGSWCSQRRIRYFVGATQRAIYAHYGLEIAPGADIGGGIYIPHPVGTVIMVEKMGQNCSVIANVTIGMRNKHTFPVIGDNVFIGAGARVLGGIEVGDNAVIGANAVVINDVPSGATVVGVPARVMRINNSPGIVDSAEASSCPNKQHEELDNP